MLQRSQTLYLLGVFILTILMFTGAIADFTGDDGVLTLKHSGVFNSQGERMELSTWPLTLFFALVSGLAFINVFSYKNRVRQMRICIFLILVSFGMAGIMFFYTWVAGNKFEAVQTLYQWRFVIPPIVIILLYLAFRGIRKDELMVKAYDRIR
ncbi:MAG: DUF4293 domain-containing protein [Bacteroidetes bacterium]|nr:DUF4293 domain-containing protein [Bacteroidota bacterium]